MRSWMLISIAIALLGPLACGAGSPTSVGPRPEAPDPVAESGTAEGGEPEDGTACAELSETACLDSPGCTVVPDGEAQRGYRCRGALAPCETGFRQAGDTAEDCTAKEGCTFDPGRCYCAPDVVCICGGGPPPRCVADGTPGSAPSQG